MRWLLPCLVFLLSGAGCASAPKSTPPAPKPVAEQAEFWSPKKPKDPPLVKLATKRQLFLIETVAGKSECRRFTLAQSKERDDDTAYLSDGEESISFVNHGSELELTHRSRSSENRGGSTLCSGSYVVQETAEGLDVNGSLWFELESDCNNALAAKSRVAMDFATCHWDPEANLQDQAASQRKFEALLRFGGVGFGVVDDNCKPVNFTPDKSESRADYFQGEMWSALRDGKLTGKTAMTYQMQRHSFDLVLLGPHSSWSDGSSMGFGCGDTENIRYGIDSVEIEQTLYLSAQSCRTALAHERARLARLPKPVEEESEEEPAPKADNALAVNAPSFGGC
jgi:hypothetical protein